MLLYSLEHNQWVLNKGSTQSCLVVVVLFFFHTGFHFGSNIVGSTTFQAVRSKHSVARSKLFEADLIVQAIAYLARRSAMQASATTLECERRGIRSGAYYSISKLHRFKREEVKLVSSYGS